jgi:hypothetical protein
MSADIPTIEPLSFIAGDTVKWTISLSDWPATDWTLKYSLMKLSATTSVISFSSTADGSAHAVVISKTTSAGYSPGKYSWQSYVENAGITEHYSISSGFLEIKPTFQTVTAFDARSDAQKTYEAIEAFIMGRASIDQARRKIGDREIQYISLNELMNFRNLYRDEYYREIGRSGPKVIKYQFGE